MIKKLLLITLIGAGSMQAASSSTTTTTATPVATTTTSTTEAYIPQPGQFSHERGNLLELSLHNTALRILHDEIAHYSSEATVNHFAQLETACAILPRELHISVIYCLFAQIILSDIPHRQELLTALENKIDAIIPHYNAIEQQGLIKIKTELNTIPVIMRARNCTFDELLPQGNANTLNSGFNLILLAITTHNNDQLKYLLLLGLLDLNKIPGSIIATLDCNNTNATILIIEHLRSIQIPRLEETINQIFYRAIIHGNIDVIHYLLDATNHSNNPDQIKAITKKPDLLLTSLKYALTLQQKKIAAPAAIEEIVKLLLKNGATICHDTIRSAAGIRNSSILEKLIKKSEKLEINLNHKIIRSDVHLTPCITAMVNRSEETALMLLKRLNDDQIKETYGNSLTLLHIAARCNLAKVATELIRRGADMNALADHGQSPLLHAFAGGASKTAQLLIDRGVDPLQLNAHLDNCLMLLIGNPAVVLKIISQGELLKCLRLALKHTPDINAQYTGGNTALHFAHTTKIGRKLIVPILLEFPVDETIKNDRGLTYDKMPLIG